MSRKPLAPAKAALYPIKPTGEIDGNKDVGVFKINPESYEETHSTGWVGNVIPGQSLPVYQWVAGGPRVISFEALVTKDTSYFNKPSSSAENIAGRLADKAISAVGSLASSLLGASLPVGQIMAALNVGPSGKFDLDISDYLEYYRSLWKPEYNLKNVSQSPPLVYLYIGTTFEKTSDIDSINPKSNVFIVTNLNIKITKQLPDLTPMEALVNFQLEQYPITSVGISQSGDSTKGLIQTDTNFFGGLV